MGNALATNRQSAKLIAQAWMDAQFCQHLMESPVSFLVETGIVADDCIQLASQVLDTQQADGHAAIPVKPADLADGSLLDQIVPLGFGGFCRGCCS